MSRRLFLLLPLLALAGCGGPAWDESETGLLGTAVKAWPQVATDRNSIRWHFDYGDSEASVRSYRVCLRERCLTAKTEGGLFSSNRADGVMKITDVKAGQKYTVKVHVNIGADTDDDTEISGVFRAVAPE